MRSFSQIGSGANKNTKRGSGRYGQLLRHGDPKFSRTGASRQSWWKASTNECLLFLKGVREVGLAFFRAY